MVETLSRGGGGSATRAAAGPSMAKENSSCVEALNCCEIVLSFWLLVRPASSSNEQRSQQAEHQCYQPPKTQESLPTWNRHRQQQGCHHLEVKIFSAYHGTSLWLWQLHKIKTLTPDHGSTECGFFSVGGVYTKKHVYRKYMEAF